ncbi:hypothetical protein [Photobacterium lipolyticum]|uniref:Uncharacterized protein n=1 Tax=Photobacterium lipolyticum TaxID=266810 RepID=A0A2T3N3M9_9GAMM|nr:hypothetical protein [Photobacterium lipolyticum]PSW06918.1 hypothetical protein C9I89_05240 [Photobacterium lipolyticum]
MSVKTIALSTLLLVSASTTIAAPGNDHDHNVSDRYANELRLKTFEGEAAYQVNVNPQLLVDHDESVSTLRATELRKQALSEPVRHVESSVQRDRDESVSTLHATELRLKAFEDNSFAMTQVGRTGGYDFSYDSVTSDIGSHHRNHH